MGLSMKNFNILGFYWKIQLLEGGTSSWITNIEGGVATKGWLKQFADLKGAWQEGGGGVFEGGEGGWYPDAHYDQSWQDIFK